MNNITCPHCGEHIEISEALRKQIEIEVGKSLSEKHEKELRDVRQKIQEEVQEKLQKRYKEEQTELQEELKESQERITKFREQELLLRREKRALEEREQELKLEVEKQIAQERKNIEAKVLQQASEEHRLRDLEKEKVISDLKKALDEAQRKASQGSQQLQGEILELDLEDMLRREFLTDTIEPIEKGVRGADLRHIVKSDRGVICGVILWEFKRTKTWQQGWIQKLKEDIRSEGAHIPVIVTTQLPKEIKNGIGLLDGVWICDISFVSILAKLIRERLYYVAREKFVQSQKGTVAEGVYDFITGHEFQQQVQALADVYQQMQLQIAKERISFEKSWKQRETQIRRLALATANIYGSLQGLAGSSMPQVRGLEMEELTSGE